MVHSMFRRSPAPALVLALALAVVAGCATTDGRPRTNPNVITLEEIQETNAANLFEVVQQLRPRWLEARAARSTYGTVSIMVYEGQSRLGDVQVLRQLPVNMAYRMRYLDGAQATSTLPGIGSGHVAGAIIIETVPR
jgi:hypothetical protein